MPADHLLTRDEARARAEQLSAITYEVTLDVTGAGPTFASHTRIHATARPGAQVFLDLLAENVREVTLNGERVDIGAARSGRVDLPALAESNLIEVTADCLYDRNGVGLHRFVDPVDGQTFLHTQFEPFDAHRVFACFDQPDLKATWQLTVRAPADWVVVSNAAVDDDTRQGSTRSWTFAVSAPMSTYLMAVVAGPFHHVHDRAGDIELGVYCRPSLAEHLDADEIFEITRQGFAEFTRAFAYPYPFGKYDQLFVPEFNWGGMENVGCVTLAEGFIFRSKVTDAARQQRGEVILHELAHMWFGDLVTMRWWDDLWLNESFATYMAYHGLTRATRFRTAWAAFANRVKGWALNQDQLPSTHPIAADIPDSEAVRTNFDGITYAKGASVLKQLVAWVGEESFFDGLADYFRRHEYGNATLSDFLAALEKTSGRALGDWSAEWLQTSGVATLRPEHTIGDDRYTSFAIVQEATAAHPTLRSHRLGVGGYSLRNGSLERTVQTDLDVTGARTEVPDLVGETVPDLLLLNDGDLTFAKVRLDERSLDTLVAHLSDLSDPLARALCWGAAWDMTRDAETAARRFVELVARHAGSETNLPLLHVLMLRAATAADTYGDPANRPDARARLATAARAALDAAEPGSDRQLAWARHLVAVGDGDDHIAWVTSLLDGESSVAGLDIDTELRWALLSRLALGESFDPGRVDAEAKRDASDIGARHAARIRASRPNVSAKEEAWAAIKERELPLATLRSIAAGFWQPSQDELLRPYVQRFADAFRELWEPGVSEEAIDLGEGLYPATVVDQALLDDTAALADDEALPSTARRILAEARDGTARALRTRAADR
ncbi:aminopeptidase N [soil metagenome]